MDGEDMPLMGCTCAMATVFTLVGIVTVHGVFQPYSTGADFEAVADVIDSEAGFQRGR